MSNPQEFSELFERLTWDEISPHVKRRVKEANFEIKNSNPAGVKHALDQLQAFFERENLLGANVRFDTALPIITDELITENGIQLIPVGDPDVLDQDYFYGSFSGCSVLEINDVEHPVLVYKLSQQIPGGFRTIQVPVDMGAVEVQNEFAEAYDEDDILIKGAFEALESVGDPDYAASLKKFRRSFEDTDLPMIIRIRQLGEYGAELLNNPEHVKHLLRQQALDVLFRQALDEEIEYEVGGYSVEPTEVDDVDSIPDVRGPHPKARALIDDIGIVTDFDLHTSADGALMVNKKDGVQPAILFLDEATRTYRTIPMKYMASIDEYQYRHRDSNPYSPALTESGLEPTCGEESRMFWRKVETGEITMGDSAIRRFMLGD